jgi:SNF2 family DNA or RNA helicase
MFDKNRSCSSYSKKKDKYTHKELENLRSRYNIILPYEKMTITEICNYFDTLDWEKLEEKSKLKKKKLEKEAIKHKIVVQKKKELLEKIKNKKIEQDKKIKEKKKEILKDKKEKIKDKEKKEILKEKEKYEKKLQNMKEQEKLKENCIKRSRENLRDYQKNVVSYLGKNDRLLVYHKMGTGKTLTAVTASQCYLDSFPNRKVIVITPASLIDNFKKGMMQYKFIKHHDRYEFYSIQKATRLLKNDELNCKNNFVIIDEVHNYKGTVKIKNGIVNSGKNIYQGYKCFLKAHKLLLLTGTPVYNRPEDMTIYKVLLNYENDKMKNKSIQDIITHYAEFDLDTLKCKISYHDFSKNDADFPDRIDIIKKIPMKQEYEKQYKKILDEIEILKLGGGEAKLLGKVFKKLTDSNKNQFSNLTRRLTQNIDNNLDLNAKLNYVIRFIKKMKRDNKNLKNDDKLKIVIYSQFKEHGIHLIIDKTKATNVPYNVISGDTKVSERQKIVNEYNSGKINILFITKAAGEGLDLKGTDAIFILEPTWNENNSEQIIARAIRYKSHENRSKIRKKVRVIHLIHTYSQDMKENTQKIIQEYLSQTSENVKKIPDFIEGEDYKMLIFQEAKQQTLNIWDKELQKLSIEKNNC